MTETNQNLPNYDHLHKKPMSQEEARAFEAQVDELIEHPELMDGDICAFKETWEKILCRISKIEFLRKQALA